MPQAPIELLAEKIASQSKYTPANTYAKHAFLKTQSREIVKAVDPTSSMYYVLLFLPLV